MSKKMKLDMYLWAYLNCKTFDGLNLSGSRLSCRQLQAGLDEFFASARESALGRLLVDTVPVVHPQLRNVASRDNKIKNYERLAFRKGDESRIITDNHRVEVTMTEQDLVVFKKALAAIQDDVGDLGILKPKFFALPC